MNQKKSAGELLLEKHANRPATVSMVVAAVDPVIDKFNESAERITALEAGVDHRIAEAGVLNIKAAIDSLRMGSMSVAQLPHISALASAYKELGINPLDRIEELRK